MARDQLIIGADTRSPFLVFPDSALDSQIEKGGISMYLYSPMLTEELVIDQLTGKVRHHGAAWVGLCDSTGKQLTGSDGMWLYARLGGQMVQDLTYGTPVRYYRDGVLLGKFYFKNFVRTDTSLYKLNCISAVGVLDGQNHPGGVYNGAAFGTVLADVIGGAVPYSIADDVAAMPVSGWLPYDTRRNNLHEMLFAHGVQAKKSEDGDLYFVFPDASAAVKAVPNSRIYLGGDVESTSPATAVEVLEHNFYILPSDETVTLFDNTDGSGMASNTLVRFSTAPVHDLTASEGLTIVRSGVNYAILTGIGTLTGKKYTHTTRTVRKTAGDGMVEKVASVTENTLVTLANAENVATRVMSYQQSAKTINADLKLENETVGDRISFDDPFEDPTTAFIASMEFNATGILWGSCELIEGYNPVASGNTYNHYQLITTDGTFTVPEGVDRIFLILGGGGDGGSSGGDGESGTGVWYQIGDPGEGGLAGTAGLPGRVLSLAIDVAPGQTFSVHLGKGGAGGVAAGLEITPGGTGEDSTFGSYSSAQGQRSNTGVFNLFTGQSFASLGLDGAAGGKGGTTETLGESITIDGVTYLPGNPGKQVTSDDGERYANGGGGGGPAYGNNGNDGGDGRVGSKIGHGGKGGAGADAKQRPQREEFSAGGDGGYGGGGGATGGRGTTTSDNQDFGDPGAGGKASNGTNGGDGFALIYY